MFVFLPRAINHSTILDGTQEGIVNRVTILMALACIAVELGFYLAIYV